MEELKNGRGEYPVIRRNDEIIRQDGQDPIEEHLTGNEKGTITTSDIPHDERINCPAKTSAEGKDITER